MREVNISVCLATYNGKKYIIEQLNSILLQLGKNDEIIISDDNSSDSTLDIIKSINDDRIKIFTNNGKGGPVYNFENALKQASGDIIFLSDQDDVWKPNKIEIILEFFEKNKNYTCVFSNAEIIDKNGNRTGLFFFKISPSLKVLNMLFKNKFLGCTMAFKNDVKILPFASNLPMHDWYIGLKHLKKGKVAYIDKPLISYRRHGENVTTGESSSILQILKWRMQLIKVLYLS